MERELSELSLQKYAINEFCSSRSQLIVALMNLHSHGITDEQIKEVDAVLQTKNVKIKTINEYTKLSQKLDKHGLSTQDVNKLVKFVMTAKRYGFDSKNVGAKMSDIKQLESRQRELVRSSAALAKQTATYREMFSSSTANL